MARSYISVGSGGPRVGAVLGRRDMAGAVIAIGGISALVFAAEQPRKESKWA
jgi:hypothetical protein